MASRADRRIPGHITIGMRESVAKVSTQCNFCGESVFLIFVSVPEDSASEGALVQVPPALLTEGVLFLAQTPGGGGGIFSSCAFGLRLQVRAHPATHTSGHVSHISGHLSSWLSCADSASLLLSSVCLQTQCRTSIKMFRLRTSSLVHLGSIEIEW